MQHHEVKTAFADLPAAEFAAAAAAAAAATQVACVS
jgi:hypothetical protein